ncbi:MAG: VCBS repeat-containing protein [Planctomycetes bacterium]|nr:VCBS repeat-containing protein [Planctomycetota bacterium]
MLLRVHCALLALLVGGEAIAYIEALYPLQQVLDESTHVVAGKIEAVNKEKRAAIAIVDRALKGRVEIPRVQLNLGIAAADQSDYTLARLQPGQPFLLFYRREGNNILSCAHLGDHWVQFYATDEPDKSRVWWRMTHIEIRMNRTFDGTTAELVKLTDDVLARRVAAPRPNPKLPSLDPRRPGPPPVRAPRVEEAAAGLEAIPGWYVDDSWARPARLAVEEAGKRGKLLRVDCDGQPERKLAVAILHHIDLSGGTRFAAEVDNASDRPLAVSVAFGAAPEWAMLESPPVSVPPRARAAQVSFQLAGRTFKSQASNWEHSLPLPNEGRVDKIMLIVEGMPRRGSVAFGRIGPRKGGGFRLLASAPRAAGGEARGLSWADVNGDERLDLYACASQGNLLLINDGGPFRELAAPFGVSSGSRAAAWADYDGDGHPDLLTGAFRLFTQASTPFRDDARLLPAPKERNPEGAGWIDYNGDGLPDALITNGEHGIRLFENTGKGPARFRDVSDKVGLGPKGLGVGNGDFVAFADYDGDGYTDFLYNLGDGVLAHNEGGKGFKLDSRAGIRFGTSNEAKRGLVFADYDNDGDLDLFVPGPARPKLYRNNNDGTFTDVASAAGDLAGAAEPSFSAAWGDVNNDGFLDLLVCYVKAPPRLYLGDGKGRFRDASANAGLGGLGLAFAASFADADDDGDLDLALSQDGRVAILANDMDRAPDRAALTVRVQARKGLVGAVVRVADDKGRPLGLRELNGGESCGGQATPVAHFGLPLGKCQLSVCLTDGRVAQKTLTIEPKGLRLAIREEDFK